MTGGAPWMLPPTEWAALEGYGDLATGARHRVRNAFIERYAPALRAHLLRRRGVPEQEVDDLVQAFVAEKLLRGDLLSRADRSRGRLRNLILTALDNYAVDRGRAGKRRRVVEADGDLELTAADDAERRDVFDVEWARALLERVLCRARESTLRDVWDVFRERLLVPLLEGREPVPYAELMQRAGLRDEKQAMAKLITAKRAFRRALYEEVGDFSDEATEEIAELQATLTQVALRGSESATTDGVAVHGLDGSDPVQLSAVFDFAAESPRDFTGGELAGLLERELSATLGDSLSGVGLRVDTALSGHPALVGSLRDLFAEPEPEAALLDLAKHYAKAKREHPTEPIPYQVAAVLYYAAIAAAWTRCGRRVTTLGAAAVADAARWCGKQTWVDERLRRDVVRALGELAQ